MVWLPRRARKRIFFTPFSPFSAQNNFFLQNCLCHIQSSISGQSHTKNQKNLWPGCRDVLKNAYFSHLFRHFRPKIFFLAKLPMPYLKQYIRLVTYQKSEKSMVWLPRNAQKCIFFTPFSPFLAKKFFFQKSGFVSFLEPQKATLIQKIRKTDAQSFFLSTDLELKSYKEHSQMHSTMWQLLP